MCSDITLGGYNVRVFTIFPGFCSAAMGGGAFVTKPIFITSAKCGL